MDASDAVKHIRRIHYILTLSCVIVMVSTIGSFGRDHNDVIEELKKIVYVIDKYESSFFVNDTIPTVEIKNNRNHKNSSLISLKASRFPGYIVRINDLVIPGWFFSNPDNEVIDSETMHYISYSLKDRPTSSMNLHKIKQFISEIDNINSIYAISANPDKGYLVNGNRFSHDFDLQKIDLPAKLTNSFPRRILLIDDITENEKIPSNESLKKILTEQKKIGFTHVAVFEYAAQVSKMDHLSTIYVPLKTNNLDAQGFLEKLLYGKPISFMWGTSSARDLFGKIVSIPNTYDELSPKNLELILEDKGSRSSSDIQLLGINFPSYDIGRWAMILIFSLHIKHAFTNKNILFTNKSMIPSIFCFFEDDISLMLLYFTVGLLPTIAVFSASRKLLLYHDNFSTLNFFFFSIIIFSSIISFKSVSVLRSWFNANRKNNLSFWGNHEDK